MTEKNDKPRGEPRKRRAPIWREQSVKAVPMPADAEALKRARTNAERELLGELMFSLGSAHATLERAIEAYVEIPEVRQ